MSDRIVATGAFARRAAALRLVCLAAAATAEAAAALVLAVSATPAAAVSVTLHPIATPGYEEPEAIAGAPGGLILKSAVGRRSVLQRVTASPFAIAAPLPVEASAIGPGPDGNVWAAVASGGSWTIGPVTPGGFAAARALAPASASMLPNLIAAGPDGSVWVGDLLGGDVERVLPEGRTVAYQGPQGAGYPTGIAFTADGIAWVTEAGTYEHIWEITPGGQVLDREIPSGMGEWGNCHCDARSITAGADGALWFVERMFGRIGRITEAGEWSALTLPDPAGAPVGELGAPRPEALTAGPDGELWFIEAGTGELGRITLAGGPAISEVPVPPARPGAEMTLQALTAFAGELWGTAVESVVTGGVVSYRRPLLFEVNPAGAAPPPAAASTATFHGAARRARCALARRSLGGAVRTAVADRRCRRARGRRRAG